LLCLGVLFLVLANHLFWINGTLLNSDNFADAVDVTMARPDVQERLATVISQEAAPEIDLQARLSARLPDELQFLVPLAGDSVTEELLHRVSLRILGSDVTNELRDQVVRNLHAQVIATLEDNDDRALQVEGDSLVLDLRPIVKRIFDRIGQPVPARLQQAGAEGKGVVVLVDDTAALRSASFFVSNRVVFLVLALIIAIGCLAGAAWISGDLRQGLSSAGFAVVAAGIVSLLIVLIGNSFIPDERVVLRELMHSLEQSLRRESLLLVIVGAAMVLGTNAGVQANVSSARRSIEAHVQRFGWGSAALLAMGGLMLLLWVT